MINDRNFEIFHNSIFLSLLISTENDGDLVNDNVKDNDVDDAF